MTSYNLAFAHALFQILTALLIAEALTGLAVALLVFSLISLGYGLRQLNREGAQ